MDKKLGLKEIKKSFGNLVAGIEHFLRLENVEESIEQLCISEYYEEVFVFMIKILMKKYKIEQQTFSDVDLGNDVHFKYSKISLILSEPSTSKVMAWKRLQLYVFIVKSLQNVKEITPKAQIEEEKQIKISKMKTKIDHKEKVNEAHEVERKGFDKNRRIQAYISVSMIFESHKAKSRMTRRETQEKLDYIDDNYKENGYILNKMKM